MWSHVLFIEFERACCDAELRGLKDYAMGECKAAGYAVVCTAKRKFGFVLLNFEF